MVISKFNPEAISQYKYSVANELPPSTPNVLPDNHPIGPAKPNWCTNLSTNHRIYS